VETVRGETPLHLAVRANQTDIVRVLVRNGAKVDAQARELQTVGKNFFGELCLFGKFKKEEMF
jgi:ankyrin repeat protein